MCDLHEDKCGALVGRGGDHIKYVQRVTETEITFEEVNESDLPKRTMTMSIVGKLLNCYAAHMLMMKRYLDNMGQAGRGDSKTHQDMSPVRYAQTSGSRYLAN